MATFAKRILSGSTSGRSILVVATATLGTTIHTAVTGTSDIDEIYLYAVNSSTADVKLTIEYGGVTSPNDLHEYTIPAENGDHLIIPGFLLQNALVVTAFAGTANVITINGWVNRITA